MSLITIAINDKARTTHSDALKDLIKHSLMRLSEEQLDMLAYQLMDDRIKLNYFGQDVEEAIKRHLGPYLATSNAEDNECTHVKLFPTNFNFIYECIDPKHKGNVHFSMKRLNDMVYDLAEGTYFRNSLGLMCIYKYAVHKADNVDARRIPFLWKKDLNPHVETIGKYTKYTFQPDLSNLEDVTDFFEIFLYMKWAVDGGNGFTVKSVKILYSLDKLDYTDHISYNFVNRPNRVTDEFYRTKPIIDYDVKISFREYPLPKDAKSYKIEVVGILDERPYSFDIEKVPRCTYPIYRLIKKHFTSISVGHRDLYTCLASIRDGLLALPPYEE